MNDAPENFKHERPYRTGGYIKPPETKERATPRTVDFLPHPEILESYNYIVEGSAKMILSMFEMEQKHRHEWEKASLKIYSVSSIIGQVLGFFIAVAVFVSATVIGIYGNTTMAAIIWVFGMAIVVMAGLVWTYAKSMGQRPLFARPSMRAHFRPVKEKEEVASR